MELPVDFLSLGRGSVKLVSKPSLGDSLPVFREFSAVFPIDFFYNDFPIVTYIVLLIIACIKY